MEVKRKRMGNRGSWIDDSGRKRSRMRERKVVGKRNMRTHHIVPCVFFSDLSLQWPIPGEKEGDRAVGRNDEKE